jgi:hypothetical protein
MTGALIKKENLDTDPFTYREHPVATEIRFLPGTTKLGDRPGTDLSLATSEGAWA